MTRKSEPVLISGNEAIAQGAIDSGCALYAGYPITPQNELIAYMAEHLPVQGGVFIQAESELAAINMVFGAAATGARAMTSSSSPGISLKQEGISYLAGAELPALIVNVMRGGPGLGNIAPAQSDYFQAVKGGGHGDYRVIVLAPASAQEAYDLVRPAFSLGEKYRVPVMLLLDGMLGQVMEPVSLMPRDAVRANVPPEISSHPWGVGGCRGREARIVRSFRLEEGALEKLNLALQKKYARIRAREARHEEYLLADCRICVVAYGTMARIAKAAVKRAREKGIRAGLLRPVTLWPFPEKALQRLCLSRRRMRFLAAEMSYGQMVEDVRLAVDGKAPVGFVGRGGGGILTEEDILKAILKEARQR